MDIGWGRFGSIHKGKGHGAFRAFSFVLEAKYRDDTMHGFFSCVMSTGFLRWKVEGDGEGDGGLILIMRDSCNHVNQEKAKQACSLHQHVSIQNR